MESNPDYNIKLYSFAELETMLRIYSNPHSNKSGIPFKEKEIKEELILRQP
jgi:hypothetical protein